MQTLIIRKIWLFGIISATISLVLAGSAFGIVEYYNIRSDSVSRLRSQMDILSYNLQPTLLFEDKSAAETILRSLQDDHAIIRARLYEPNGNVFADYVRSAASADINIRKDIIYDQRVIGRLEIASIYLGLRDQLTSYALICILIILVSIPAAYVISGPIRKQVALGITQLEQQSNRLRLLADQVAATEQRERKRIAAIIHDHLQQILVASKLHLAQALRIIKTGQYDQASNSLARSEEFLNEAIRAAKSLTVELRPPVLYEDGLAAAFQWLAHKFKNDHDLDVSLDLGEIPPGLSDHLKILIFEAAKELLFNVVKYADVRTAELSLRYEEDAILMAVSDRGRGFDLHHVEKTASDKGFGLFSIRERLKLLDGEFTVLSRPGEGTTVEVHVPVDVAREEMSNVFAGADEKPAKRPQKDQRIKILLVDDHKIVREGIANLLRENPVFHVVAQAENGQEAVEKADLYQPDVIIMDINMPKLNGIEATRRIKHKHPNMTIIGLSVQDEKDVAESMKKAGAVTLLNKAGDPQELVQTVLSCA